MTVLGNCGSHRPAPGQSLVVVVEIQLSIDPRKRFSWPVYVATAAARFECEVHLLVLTPDAAVARWAKGPFGPSRDFLLHPIVLAYEDLPEHLDEEAARRFPELAVLTSLAHPSLANAHHALDLVRSLPSDRGELYCDLILKALADTHGSILEVSMFTDDYQYQSDFAREYFAKGLRKGQEEGLRKGEEEGLRKGQEEGLRKGREQGLQEAEERQLAALQAIALELARGKLGELLGPLVSALRFPRDGARLSALILELGQATRPEEARDAIVRACS